MTRADRDEILALAAAASNDPFPDEVGQPTRRAWFYAPDEYELATLARLVREGLAANRYAHYATDFGRVRGRARFRVLDAPAIHLPAGTDAERLGDEIEVRAPADEPAAIALDPRCTATVEVLIDGGWVAVAPRSGGDSPPHLEPEPAVRLPLTERGGLLTTPAPVLGRVVIEADRRPGVSTGETPEEAHADPNSAETRHEVRPRADGRWESVHELGFRFARVDPHANTHVEARIRPAPRRGAFVCSDPALNRIWGTAAYTLRLSMQRLMLDGIKRDRMPWAGDQALATLANAYSFGDGGIVRDSLIALGRPSRGYVNGISDYSLWWLINLGMHHRQFGDTDFLRREAPQIASFAARLAEETDAAGLFDPHGAESEFDSGNEGSVFLDWGVTVPPGHRPVALQLLWIWALRSASEVLRAVRHPSGARWGDLAARATEAVLRRGRDATTGRWQEFLDVQGDGTHAAFLAQLTGVGPAAPLSAEYLAGRTPFMLSFALLALARSGDRAAALEQVRSRWSPMLDTGTFWEEFPIEGEDHRTMYGRPFGRSLSHAWASGPAALLPEIVLGVRPVAPGWARFEVDPQLGDLAWAAAVVPSPCGDIVVHAEGREVEVEVPTGAVLLWKGRELTGRHRLSTAEALAG